MPDEIGPTLIAIAGVMYVLFEVRNNTYRAFQDVSGNVVFPLVPSIRIVLAIAGPVFLLGAYLSFVDPATPWWISGILASAGAAAAAVSSVVVVTPAAVQCRWAWGLYVKRIEWSQIESATEIPGEQTIEIRSRSGVTIRHSNSHVDSERLVAELVRRGVPINRQGGF